MANSSTAVTLELHEEALGTGWLVQGLGASAEFQRAAERIIGCALPAPHRWVKQSDYMAYWVGPTAWLVTHAPALADYEDRRDALIAAGGALFDVTAARSVIHVGGELAGELLAKGCGIDFDHDAFPPGECRSTLIARVGVLVARKPALFTLFTLRSYAASLWHWLQAGARQYRGG